MVRDSATTRRDRLPYATAAGDRSKHCRSVAPWPNRNQSYDPEIVRSGVTVALRTVAGYRTRTIKQTIALLRNKQKCTDSFFFKKCPTNGTLTLPWCNDAWYDIVDKACHVNGYNDTCDNDESTCAHAYMFIWVRVCECACVYACVWARVCECVCAS